MKPICSMPGSWEGRKLTRDEVQEWMLSSVGGALGQDLRSVLVHAPTGVGKTVFAAKRALEIQSKGGRMVFLCHMKTLVEQAEKVFRKWGVDVQVEQGPRKVRCGYGSRRFHVIALVKSLHSRRIDSFLSRSRLGDSPVEVVADECHLATGTAWISAIKALNPASAIGLTATPTRMDGKPLVGQGAPFEALACRYDFLSACRHGILVPPVYSECEGSIDLRDIKVTRQAHGRDYDPGQLVARINEKLGHVCRASRDEMDHWGLKRCLMFLPDVATCRHAERMLSGLARRDGRNIACRAVYGELPDRDAVLRRYHAGDLEVLIGCQMLDVGFDDEPTDGVILATPTKSRVKAVQQLGRGARLWDGKTRFVAIGFRWESADEGPVSTLDLLLRQVRDPEVRRKAAEIALGRRGLNIVDAIEAAEVERAREVAEARRRGLDLPVACTQQAASYTRRVHDPLEVKPALDAGVMRRLRAIRMGNEDVVGWSDGRALAFLDFWEEHTLAGGVTFKQADRLLAWGWAKADVMRLTSKDAQRILYLGSRGR